MGLLTDKLVDSEKNGYRLERLKVLYKERYMEHHDIDHWNDAIEESWPKIADLIDAAEGIKQREEIGGYGHEGIPDLLKALEAVKGGK